MKLALSILGALGILCAIIVGVLLTLYLVRENQRQLGPGWIGRVFCWLGEHTDGNPNPMHWHTMTCVRCGKDFEL